MGTNQHLVRSILAIRAAGGVAAGQHEVVHAVQEQRRVEGAEEPEKLLKNPYFAFFTLFLVVIFILAYILK